MTKNYEKIFDMVLFAILIALCFGGTSVMIPLPTGGKIHLGNLVCILSALLLGGVKGGLIGSIGMGLNDLIFYLDSPSTIIRTIILKFIMGFICGSLFSLLKRKNPKSEYCSLGLMLLGLLFLGVAIYSLYVYLIGGITFDTNTLTFNVLVPIGLFIFGIAFIVIAIIFIRKKAIINYLLISVSLATMANILGEFIFRAVLYNVIDRMGAEASLTLSLSQVPASILTGTLTFIVTLIVYPPLEKAINIIYKNIKSRIEN